MSDYVLGSADEEILPLTKETTLEAAVQHLCGQNERTVIARQGADGVSVFSAQGRFDIPAFPAEIVDTLGAGDAFNSGFIAGCVQGIPLSEAVRWGNAAAAIAIGRKGARGAPTKPELMAFIRKHSI